MNQQQRGKNGGSRPGAGRKPKSIEPSLKLRELILEKDLNLLDAQYESLLAVTREMMKRLREDPKSYTNQQLISLSKSLTKRMEKTIQSYGITSNKFLSLRYEVLQRDGFTCRYCGRSPLQHSVELQADHILPKSKGGLDELDNLITSCSDCNLGKSDVILSERLLVKVKNSVRSDESLEILNS